jgi:excisionase family DNA binding protein
MVHRFIRTVKLLTVSEAARIRNVSADTIRRWAKVGRLKIAVRLGNGERLFDEADVIAA